MEQLYEYLIGGKKIGKDKHVTRYPLFCDLKPGDHVHSFTKYKERINLRSYKIQGVSRNDSMNRIEFTVADENGTGFYEVPYKYEDVSFFKDDKTVLEFRYVSTNLDELEPFMRKYKSKMKVSNYE